MQNNRIASKNETRTCQTISTVTFPVSFNDGHVNRVSLTRAVKPQHHIWRFSLTEQRKSTLISLRTHSSSHSYPSAQDLADLLTSPSIALPKRNSSY